MGLLWWIKSRDYSGLVENSIFMSDYSRVVIVFSQITVGSNRECRLTVRYELQAIVDTLNGTSGCRKLLLQMQAGQQIGSFHFRIKKSRLFDLFCFNSQSYLGFASLSAKSEILASNFCEPMKKLHNQNPTILFID